MLRFKWNNGRTLEVRVLELGPDFITFRVDLKRKADFLSEKPAFVSCCILDYGSRDYITVNVKEFEIKLRTEEDTNGAIKDDAGRQLSAVFELISTDEAFLTGIKKISDDYSAYIIAKLQHDEQALLKVLTGNEITEEYASSLADWKRTKTAECSWDSALNSCQIAIVADDRLLAKKFLEMNRDEYINWYWKENGLAGHDIAKVHVSHIYFGSQYCVHLLPSCDVADSLIDKALIQDLKPVICFPPMSEGNEELFKEIIIAACGHSYENIEFVINDIGTVLMINELVQEGKINSDDFSLSAGVMLNKRKKDPRAEYAFMGNMLVEVNGASSFKSRLFVDHLKELNVSRFSYECGIRKSDIILGGGILHLPLYQTNTASRCTMQSVIEDGSRSIQKYKNCCPGYCSEHAFLYPNDSNIVGIGNSLFGFRKEELSDVCVLNELIESGIERLVIRL